MLSKFRVKFCTAIGQTSYIARYGWLLHGNRKQSVLFILEIKMPTLNSSWLINKHLRYYFRKVLEVKKEVKMARKMGVPEKLKPMSSKLMMFLLRNPKHTRLFVKANRDTLNQTLDYLSELEERVRRLEK